MYRLIVLSAFALLAASASSAQTTGAATIVGSVTDASGAAIPSARVTVVNAETNFQFGGVTNQDGYYYLPYLRPGTYNVTIEAPGFKRYVREASSCALTTSRALMPGSRSGRVPNPLR